MADEPQSLDYSHKMMLRRRGIEDPCHGCNGYGVKDYSSGATWRGGMGTTRGEKDICDKCWGSGEKSRPWTDLRKLEYDLQERVRIEALTHFARGLGVAYDSMKPALDELALELIALAKKRPRKGRPQFFDIAIIGLLRALGKSA